MDFVYLVWEYTMDGPEFMSVHRCEADADNEANWLQRQHTKRYGHEDLIPYYDKDRYGVETEELR